MNQPLVHFLLLGALVFIVDALVSERADDPRRIVIDDAKYEELKGIFRDNQGRDPTPREQADLAVKWAQNEIFYREARLMGLDRGDEMIRDRLVLKVRNIYFNRVDEPSVDDTTLERWFELHRTRYDTPERYDVEQFLIGEVSMSRETALAFVEQLGTNVPTDRALRRYWKRPAPSLKAMFEELPGGEISIGKWHLVSSTLGWHALRLTAHHPREPASFDEIRTRVREDFKYTQVQTQLATELSAVAQQYDIRMELSEAPEGWDEELIDLSVDLANRGARSSNGDSGG